MQAANTIANPPTKNCASAIRSDLVIAIAVSFEPMFAVTD
jgi:hypothetical protein